MHDERERTLHRGHHIATRVSADLYDLIAADAARLGCSLSDAARWRLSSGTCPVMPAAPAGAHRNG
jgi:hypothetical protein